MFRREHGKFSRQGAQDRSDKRILELSLNRIFEKVAEKQGMFEEEFWLSLPESPRMKEQIVKEVQKHFKRLGRKNPKKQDILEAIDWAEDRHWSESEFD